MEQATYSQDSNELGVADSVIFVEVEAIEDGAELLGSEENTECVHEFVEFLLVEAAIASFIVGLINSHHSLKQTVAHCAHALIRVGAVLTWSLPCN